MNKPLITPYGIFIVVVLIFLQFTVILDFMVLSPLGAMLLEEFDITAAQFGILVSAYAWSAGISGLFSAGFADKFDRKKLLLFFYTGFIIGTALCGIATDYTFLLAARIITGIFGGVIGSVIYAIVTDLFVIQIRGSVMGFLQMAFAGASVLGLPAGLYLASFFGWHIPFLLIAGLCVFVLLLIIVFMKPVNAHLANSTLRNPAEHLARTISNPSYAKAFATTLLLATGGFMLMPFGSVFAVQNNGISMSDLPQLYFITGVCSMCAAPLIGVLSDIVGKYVVFCICSVVLIVSTVIYCNLGITPVAVVTVFSAFMFTSYAGRMVSSSALITAVPEALDRGAFMSINSAVNMISGGIASLIAGAIVFQSEDGRIRNYDILGYVVAGATVVTIAMLYLIDKMVKQKQLTKASLVETPNEVEPIR
ncbi:MFS transporter [Fulvivirgaceae bacterium PWU4]|uniref:MFS transporter n=1 Tax=Chryseosolibacter histidini TaxID=2782349 RepID=A0AAP2GM81_9BACT|nr:MFS transporter [Chryseosolibacter histidini]MBT1695335.1 MFS transporter [Chryseosolibacter histidini]